MTVPVDVAIQKLYDCSKELLFHLAQSGVLRQYPALASEMNTSLMAIEEFCEVSDDDMSVDTATPNQLYSEPTETEITEAVQQLPRSSPTPTLQFKRPEWNFKNSFDDMKLFLDLYEGKPIDGVTFKNNTGVHHIHYDPDNMTIDEHGVVFLSDALNDSIDALDEYNVFIRLKMKYETR